VESRVFLLDGWCGYGGTDPAENSEPIRRVWNFKVWDEAERGAEGERKLEADSSE